MFEYNGEQSGPYLKRIPTRIDRIKGIQTYGKDNLYPQRALEIFYQSYSLKACVRCLCDFTHGQGFVNSDLNKIIVNDDGIGGTTLFDLLKLICWEYSWSDGIPLHVGYNMLGQMNNLRHIRFEYNRMGLADDENEVSDYKYSVNWEGDKAKNGQRRVWVDSYHKFNPDPEVVLQQIEEAGGIANYKGQLLYLTPIPDEYPKVTFDAVMDHAQTQGDSGEFAVGITQNAFLGNTAVVYSGEFESEEERLKFQNYINGKRGARNAGKMIGIQSKNPDVDVKKMFQNLDMPRSDRMFEYTDKHVKDAIRENYAIPMEVLGIAPETGMFNQSNIREAYNLYNSKTQPRRDVVSSLFKKLFAYWVEPIDDDFEIKPQQYTSTVYDDKLATVVIELQDSISQGKTTTESAILVMMKVYNFSEEDATMIIGTPVSAAPAGAAPVAPGAPAAAGGDPAAVQPITNQVLTNMTGRQNQNLKRILREFKADPSTRVLTKTHLQTGFGLTDQQIEDILNEAVPQPVEP